eukprot:2194454-Rhodomonas_salina.2
MGRSLDQVLCGSLRGVRLSMPSKGRRAQEVRGLGVGPGNRNARDQCDPKRKHAGRQPDGPRFHGVALGAEEHEQEPGVDSAEPAVAEVRADDPDGRAARRGADPDRGPGDRVRGPQGRVGGGGSGCKPARRAAGYPVSWNRGCRD